MEAQDEKKKKRKGARRQSYLSKKRKCFKKLSEEQQNVTEEQSWADTIPSSRLDLLVAVKQLAMERASSLGDVPVAGIFTWKTLQCIDLVLEEFMKDRLATLGLLPGVEW